MDIGNIKVINGAQYSSDGKVLLRCHSNTTGDFIVPDGVKIIKKKAFFMSKIRSVKFPDSLEYIEDNAFYRCNSLEHVDLGRGNPYMLIADFIFAYCYSLKYVDIPETISIIGKSCFKECPLERIVLHEGIIKIDRTAFYPAKHIKEVHLPATLMDIDPDNFLYAEKVYAANPYCNGVIQMCIAAECLTECHMNRKTIYIPKGNHNMTYIDEFISGHIQFNIPEILSYLDMLNKMTTSDVEKFESAVKIAQKTGSEEMLEFLKENQDCIANFLQEERDTMVTAVRLNIFNEENLMKILHTDCFANDIVMHSHVLEALKKYDGLKDSDFTV